MRLGRRERKRKVGWPSFWMPFLSKAPFHCERLQLTEEDEGERGKPSPTRPRTPRLRRRERERRVENDLPFLRRKLLVVKVANDFID